ncbi:S-adenosyl-L-methionine-dependent methyltransferase [Bimuria novae-zelandiae CBS 107.79]|uniref:S-adenosyl-L-methionine-dependent methyltransferase n=1 Tax=Bimuria novae-zelandiae CBS 107.79 TaxID=1447943 RepID=A0A6A5VPY9_9PLEO|nr:S-adenosyl-L-methionine-dependent methyltransferase [Bimuria novae-zelandiae CBS 107.79]
MTAETQQDSWMASGSDLMRKAMQNRRLLPDVPHMKPIIDNLPAGSVVCEVGCGPGGITLDIAQRYPQLTVLGMDIDEDSIKLAKAAAAKAGTTNVRYAHGDACALETLAAVGGFGALNGGCDIVYSHAAIMHTSDQLAAIKQMRSACKPSGTISLKEGDMGLFFAYPENPGMKKWLETFPVLGLSKGADPYLGRKLMSLILAAGYTHAQIKDVSMSGQMQWRPQVKPGMVMGFGQMIKQAELAEEDKKLIIEGLEEWSKCEDGVVSFPSVIVTAVK